MRPRQRDDRLIYSRIYCTLVHRIIRIKMSYYHNIIVRIWILPDDRIHFSDDRQLNALKKNPLWIKLATTIFARAWILPKGNSTHENLHKIKDYENTVTYYDDNTTSSTQCTHLMRPFVWVMWKRPILPSSSVFLI